jgi:hypothetical protein
MSCPSRSYSRDSRIINFVLQQLQWWGLADEEGLLAEHLDKFETHFPAAVRAATANEDLDVNERKELGGMGRGRANERLASQVASQRAPDPY